MAVSEAVDQLFEYALSYIFLKRPSLPDIAEEVTTSTDFNDEQDVLRGLKVLEQADDVSVSGLFQDQNLLEDLLPLRVLAEIGLVDTLHGNNLMSEPVQCHIDFTKGTLAKKFTNPIEVYGSDWDLASQTE